MASIKFSHVPDDTDSFLHNWPWYESHGRCLQERFLRTPCSEKLLTPLQTYILLLVLSLIVVVWLFLKPSYSVFVSRKKHIPTGSKKDQRLAFLRQAAQ